MGRVIGESEIGFEAELRLQAELEKLLELLRLAADLGVDRLAGLGSAEAGTIDPGREASRLHARTPLIEPREALHKSAVPYGSAE